MFKKYLLQGKNKILTAVYKYVHEDQKFIFNAARDAFSTFSQIGLCFKLFQLIMLAQFFTNTSEQSTIISTGNVIQIK